MKMIASKTKALAIASWAFSSAIETFVNPMADSAAKMHFTVKAVSSSNFNPSVDGAEANFGNV